MKTKEVQIVPTGGALGAEVRGIDLREPLSTELAERLRTAFFEHCVLFFRNQQISEEDQVRFTRHFGNPIPHVREQPDRPIKEIFIISNVQENGQAIGALGNEELEFHSDLSYMPKPGTISMLYAIEVPASGGDTSWANSYAAYEALDDEMKKRLEGLKAIHRHSRPQQNPPVPASHPIIRTHPETRRKLLYVNPDFTKYIEGLSEAESRELLDQLFAHATQPRFVWTHKWRVGDLLMWDNRCTMHRRDAFDANLRRIMKRTQVFGEETF